MTDSVPELVQSLSPGNIVDLYEVDTTVIGYSEHYYFTPSSQIGNDLSFAGQQYTSAPVKITGFKKNSDGTSVQPEFVFPNVNKAGTGLLIAYKDLIGAKVIRRRTFSSFLDYLDDGVTPNPFADGSSQFIPEIWYVEQKTDHNRTYIKFVLSAVTDFSGQFLPTRRIWKDLCERTYRYYDPALAGFNYSGVTCPYTGTASFDINGATTTDPNDFCGKDFKACLLRFPDPDTSPGYFFPGVQRVAGYLAG